MLRVAVLDTAVEVGDIVQNILEDEGFSTVSSHILSFKREHTAIIAFFRQHRPQVVIYDIAPCYEESWQFLQEHVIPASGLAAHHFVMTTTNKVALERFIGPTSTSEMVERPFDLNEIIDAVYRAIAHPADE